MLLTRLTTNTYSACQQARYLSNKSALLTKVHRAIYARMYPTLIVEPDGSSYTCRYFEPRKIIRLPINVATLSEEEREVHFEKRRPKKKVVIQADIEDNFDRNKFLKLLKKR